MVPKGLRGSLVDVWQIFCRDTDACAEGPDFDYGAGANGVVYAPLGDGFRESGDNGFFAAMDGATGEFDWKVPNPIADEGSPPANYPPAFGGVDMSIHAPTTVANGVVFAAPFDLEGHMLALDAATGALL